MFPKLTKCHRRIYDFLWYLTAFKSFPLWVLWENVLSSWVYRVLYRLLSHRRCSHTSFVCGSQVPVHRRVQCGCADTTIITESFEIPRKSLWILFSFWEKKSRKRLFCLQFVCPFSDLLGFWDWDTKRLWPFSVKWCDK